MSKRPEFTPVTEREEEKFRRLARRLQRRGLTCWTGIALPAPETKRNESWRGWMKLD